VCQFLAKGSSMNDVMRRERWGFTILWRDVGKKGGGLKAAWRHARHICGKAVSRDFARKLVRQFSQQRSFLHSRTFIHYAYVSNVLRHTKNWRCVWNSYRSVGYTTDCKGGLEVCDVILGGPEQRDETWRRGRREGAGVIFSLKLLDVIYGRPL